MLKLTRTKVLVIDDAGDSALETSKACLLFQAICSRYDKGQSVILTSDKAFGQWGEVFTGDAAMASAATPPLTFTVTVTASKKSGRLELT